MVIGWLLYSIMYVCKALPYFLLLPLSFKYQHIIQLWLVIFLNRIRCLNFMFEEADDSDFCDSEALATHFLV